MPVGLIVVILIVVAVAGLGWAFSYERVAHKLGMKFDLAAVGLRATGCRCLPFLQHKGWARNLLHGHVDGVETAVVQFQEEYEGKPDEYTRAVICFRLPGRSLPPFELRRRNAFFAFLPSSSWSPLPFRKIELEGNSDFSSAYHLLLLGGGDEAALRKLFTPEVMAFFVVQGGDGWFAQAAGEWVGIIHTNTWLAMDTKAFVDKARRVYELFARAKV